MKFLPAFLFCANLAFGQFWTQLPDFPGAQRDDGVAVTFNGKCYFGTGLTSSLNYDGEFFEWDSASNNWLPVNTLPDGRQYACAFAGPDGFFVFGGYGTNGPLNDLYKYDGTTSHAWSTVTEKPGNAVFGASCLEFGDKIIIVGGKSQSNAAPTSEVWQYTISSDTWQQKNDFPFGGRFRASATVLNGTGYLLFGADNNSHFRKELYAYDPATDAWTKIMDFPQPAARVYATLKAVNNKLILFGGIDSTLTCYKDVWYYHPDNASWTQSPDFLSFARKGGMGTVAGNTFYYSCGIDQNNNRLKETWMTDVPVGINEPGKEELFSMYPNPVQDILYLQSEKISQIINLSISDVSGKELKQLLPVKLNEQTLQLDLRDLNEGTYFLKLVRTDKSVEWKRMLKQ